MPFGSISLQAFVFLNTHLFSHVVKESHVVGQTCALSDGTWWGGHHPIYVGATVRRHVSVNSFSQTPSLLLLLNQVSNTQISSDMQYQRCRYQNTEELAFTALLGHFLLPCLFYGCRSLTGYREGDAPTTWKVRRSGEHFPIALFLVLASFTLPSVQTHIVQEKTSSNCLQYQYKWRWLPTNNVENNWLIFGRCCAGRLFHDISSEPFKKSAGR